MQDQVKSLNEAGIHAAYINSSLTEGQINKALSFAARGVYKICLLYTSFHVPGRAEVRTDGQLTFNIFAFLHQGISKLVVGMVFREIGGFGEVCGAVVLSLIHI